VVDDACNTDSSTPIDKSHVDRGINAEKACSIQSSPCNLHTAPSTDSTVTEVEEKVASIQLDGSGRELVESAVDQAAQDISRVSLRTEDQTTISHCSSPSFLSNFDAEASLLNHVSFLQSKDEYAKKRCRKNISAYRAERPPSDLASAVNNAVEEEEAFRNSTRSPEADLSFEGDPANSTEYLAIQVENAHYDITTNTVANTTRFAALEHAFDGLLDAAEGPSMVLRREVSLYIQSQMIDEANILNEEQTDRTLDAKRLLRDSLPAAELQSTNCASLDISGKNIDSIYGLVDLCPELQSLKADNNLIYFLAGAPMTLTFVSLRNNNLNDMTIFEHLPNLHHLDISFNKLISLKALSGLKHLRELHVDGNLLESLHGIDACGGLVKVSAVNNRIKISEPEIWHGLGQLEFLDLTGNCLTDLAGLDRLANLVVLRAGKIISC
jgi:hypothetical protein